MITSRVTSIEPAGRDTHTYWLELTNTADRERYWFRPGQFNMLYLWGLGEVPISIASDPAYPERLAHTIKVAGTKTAGFPRLRVGDEIGLRGPFGRAWPVDTAVGGDLLIVAGGLGLAPVRSVVYVALRRRWQFRRVIVLVGARTPADVVYRDEVEAWRARPDLDVEMTVDTVDSAGDDAWPHHTGLVTGLLGDAGVDPRRTTAMVCGPEPMMTATAGELVARKVDPERVFVSLERNMHCGVKRCGHCQLGPSFVCADGPVYSWAEMAPWLRVAEL